MEMVVQTLARSEQAEACTTLGFTTFFSKGRAGYDLIGIHHGGAMADQVPDPSRSYERAKPEAESGMGRLDNNKSTPTNQPDRAKQAVKNKQPPRQINAHEVTDENRSSEPGSPPPPRDEADRSMYDEEPLGEDLTPTDIHEKRNQRHPRTEGKGGTP